MILDNQRISPLLMGKGRNCNPMILTITVPTGCQGADGRLIAGQGGVVGGGLNTRLGVKILKVPYLRARIIETANRARWNKAAALPCARLCMAFI